MMVVVWYHRRKLQKNVGGTEWRKIKLTVHLCVKHYGREAAEQLYNQSATFHRILQLVVQQIRNKSNKWSK